MDERQEMICDRCNIILSPMKTDFSYLGHSFRADVLRCSGCGQVYLPEDLVKGRIAEVEEQYEDK